jgi:hypothetical protein
MEWLPERLETLPDWSIPEPPTIFEPSLLFSFSMKRLSRAFNDLFRMDLPFAFHFAHQLGDFIVFGLLN